jgi:hypothetical protein
LRAAISAFFSANQAARSASVFRVGLFSALAIFEAPVFDCGQAVPGALTPCMAVFFGMPSAA